MVYVPQCEHKPINRKCVVIHYLVLNTFLSNFLSVARSNLEGVMCSIRIYFGHGISFF